MKRLMLGLALAAVVGGIAFAAAGQLNVQAKTLQAGTVSLTCQSNQAYLDWAVIYIGVDAQGNPITYTDSPRLSNIDSDCIGKFVLVWFYQGQSAVGLASGTLTTNNSNQLTAFSFLDGSDTIDLVKADRALVLIDDPSDTQPVPGTTLPAPPSQ